MLWRIARGLTIALLLIGPVVALLVAGIGLDETPESVDPAPVPVLVRASTVSVSEPLPVRIAMRFGAPAVVRAPAWTGLVQEVLLQRGQSVRSGTPVTVVERTTRIALRTPHPLSRSLRRGDKGADVAELQTALAALGYDIPAADGIYGSDTANAVKALQAVVGVPVPSTVFDPALVIWLPADEFVVAKVSILVGTAAPSAGTEILTADPTAESAELRTETGAVLADPGPGRVLRIASESWGPVESSMLGPEQVTALADAVRSGAVVPRASSPGQPADLVEIDASTELAEPKERSIVPAGAVVGESNSTTQCLYTLAGDTFTPLVVSVEPAALGTVAVDPAPLAGTDILANPLEIVPESRCS